MLYCSLSEHSNNLVWHRGKTDTTPILSSTLNMSAELIGLAWSCSGEMLAEAQRLKHLCWVWRDFYAAVHMFLACWNMTINCRFWNGLLLCSCFQRLGAFTQPLIGEQLSISAWGPHINPGLSCKICCKALQPQTAPRCSTVHSHWLQGLLKWCHILLVRIAILLSNHLTFRPFHNHLAVVDSLMWHTTG